MSALLELAERLTATQAAAVRPLSEHPADMSVEWSVRVGYGLERLGLAKRTLLSDKTYLTALGLQVQSILRVASGTETRQGEDVQQASSRSDDGPTLEEGDAQ